MRSNIEILLNQLHVGILFHERRQALPSIWKVITSNIAEWWIKNFWSMQSFHYSSEYHVKPMKGHFIIDKKVRQRSLAQLCKRRNINDVMINWLLNDCLLFAGNHTLNVQFPSKRGKNTCMHFAAFLLSCPPAKQITQQGMGPDADTCEWG